jgi:hypothetical protein
MDRFHTCANMRCNNPGGWRMACVLLVFVSDRNKRLTGQGKPHVSISMLHDGVLFCFLLAAPARKVTCLNQNTYVAIFRIRDGHLLLLIRLTRYGNGNDQIPSLLDYSTTFLLISCRVAGIVAV